jgi:rod shape-determining protein MreC
VNHRSRARITPTSTPLTPLRASRRSVASWTGIACFVLLAVVSLTLLTWKVKNRVPVVLFENVLLSMTGPFQQVATWTTRSLRGVWDDYVYLVNVRRDNTRLREEVKWLQQENHRYLEAYLQYQRLQRLLNFREQMPMDVIAAAVVGRTSNSWTEIIYINRGTRDKVAQGFPVVTYDGLVGQVIHAAPTLSQVMLLTDFRSGVDVIVQRTRASGVVAGRGHSTAELKFLPVGADLQEGDRLISSGMGGVFPKGLIIGDVKDIHRNGRQTPQVVIHPSVEFSHLEEVLVLIKP